MTRAIAISGALLAVAAPAAAQTVAGYGGSTTQRMSVSLSATNTELTRGAIEFKARDCRFQPDGATGTVRPRGLAIGSDRHFSGRGTERHRLRARRNFAGGTQVERWRLRGRVWGSDREVIRGVLRVTVELRRRDGSLADTCVTRRAIRFRALRLGIGAETVES